jgi:hypothetical protein
MGDVASGFFDTGHGAFPVCLSLSLRFKPSLSLSLSPPRGARAEVYVESLRSEFWWLKAKTRTGIYSSDMGRGFGEAVDSLQGSRQIAARH